MNKIFRNLTSKEIELRVGEVREKGCTLLLYKNARVDMDILDETFGPFGWQRVHEEIKGVMYCGISIWDKENNHWVTKWDAGTESFTESQKGEASDSFKRADVNWGIGRELYTGPQIFHFCQTEVYKDKNGKDKYKLKNRYETYGMYVSKINYDDNNFISYLQIMDKKNLVVYEFGETAADKIEPEVINSAMAKTIIGLADLKGTSVAEICKACKVENIHSLTHEQAGKVKARLMKMEDKK